MVQHVVTSDGGCLLKVVLASDLKEKLSNAERCL
jgi:hypothetical protein